MASGNCWKECVCVFSHSAVSDSASPWTVAGQSPLSIAFSRQEYWSGLPFLPPGDLPDSGIEPASSQLAGGFFINEPPEKTVGKNMQHNCVLRLYLAAKKSGFTEFIEEATA